MWATPLGLVRFAILKKLIVCYNISREIPDVGPSALSATLLVIEGKAGLPKLAFFRYMDNLLST